MEDIAFHLAPISADEAMQMLVRTRSYERLQRYGGQVGIDLDAVAAGLQRISQLATDFPLVKELEIHPFTVGEIGGESVAVGARMTLSNPGATDDQE